MALKKNLMRKNTRFATLLTFAFIQTLSATAATAQNTSDTWDSLKQITHGASYFFVRRDRSCVAGRIQSVTDSATTIERIHEPSVSIERQDLLRVTQGHSYGVLYSARSSWFDVQGLGTLPQRLPRRTIRLRSKSGRQYEGKLVSVTDNGVTISSSGKSIDIAKDEIDVLDYLRVKPMSDAAEYADEELVWMKIFDPELWPYMFGFAEHVPVRLYDSSLPQDDSPIQCKNNPWNSDSRFPPPYVTQH